MEISACFAPWEAEEPPMSHFEYMGRCVALVILHKRVYDAHMSPAFFKTLLGRRVTLCDLRPVDADLYRSLCWMLENDITGVLDETFTVTEPVRGGGVRTVELCAGGEHIKVTQSNKRSYVDARVRYRLYGRVQRQTEAFRKGLNGIVPIGLLQDFTEQELSVLFCAAPNVDMKIWMTRTRYTGYTSTDLVIMWFWKCVNEWTDAQRAKLLLFVTGTPRVSVGEFQDELSRRGPNDFIIERAGNPWDLPTSHACASTLHLPPYPHYETLKKKLLYAVE
ncbi:hypothetical protein BD626DRAFT_414843 [Schizophyllum amplum]|uniref:HECT-type E3 ubiquitin transferase n=1 Tax=Schizophyllum amplum TaxID=97359 RepID=A0A550BTW3_9AGAR|nr:hypothetical protein BD626DRAFT_414843 [Auriculariopsis ampla]